MTEPTPTTNQGLHSPAGGVLPTQSFEEDPASATQRKMMWWLLAPMLLVATTLFAFFGGGRVAGAARVATPTVNATNYDMPSPIVRTVRSKKEAYARAEEQEKRELAALRRDPYASVISTAADTAKTPSWSSRLTAGGEDLKLKLDRLDAKLEEAERGKHKGGTADERSPTAARRTARASSSSARVREHPRRVGVAGMADEEAAALAQLEAAFAAAAGEETAAGAPPAGFAQGVAPGLAAGDPMAAMLMAGFEEEAGISSEDSLAAAQLTTIDRVMERVMYLRHPELVEEQLRERSVEEERHVFPVGQATASEREVRYFGYAPEPSARPAKPTGFFGTESTEHTPSQMTVRAQVHATSTVAPGATVKLRLLDDVYLSGVRIPANTFVYATTGLSADRMDLTVESITYRGNIYAVALQAYDLDGQPGVAVPELVERRLAKQQARRTTRSVGRGAGIGTGSIVEQVASEGLRAARVIANGSMATVKIKLKAGHRLILRNGR